jgi:hypothetical protein
MGLAGPLSGDRFRHALLAALVACAVVATDVGFGTSTKSRL